MLYTEFLEGTGCKNSPYNYGVYKAIDALYMQNDKMTKTDAYEAGKRLVDNSKTAEEVKQEEEVKALIASYNGLIEQAKQEHSRYSSYISLEDNPEYLKMWKARAKQARREVTEYRNKVHSLELRLWKM
jgi:hypothetical protein